MHSTRLAPSRSEEPTSHGGSRSAEARSKRRRSPGHSDLEMTGEYTFVTAERQNELTRRIQEKLANFDTKKKQQGTTSPLAGSGVLPNLVDTKRPTSVVPPRDRGHRRPDPRWTPGPRGIVLGVVRPVRGTATDREGVGFAGFAPFADLAALVPLKLSTASTPARMFQMAPNRSAGHLAASPANSPQNGKVLSQVITGEGR